MTAASIPNSRVDTLTGASWIRRPGRCPRAWSSAGFTLVELMITVLVGAILLSIAIPSFRNFVQDTRLSSEASSLVYSLTLARDDAVKMDTPVEVCASSNGMNCGGTWASGWIVLCPDSCPGGGPSLLQVAPALSTGNTVSEQISGAPDLSYSANGQAGASYQFVFCDNRGVTSGRDVEINSIGRVEAAQKAGQQVSGAALATC